MIYMYILVYNIPLRVTFRRNLTIHKKDIQRLSNICVSMCACMYVSVNVFESIVYDKWQYNVILHISLVYTNVVASVYGFVCLWL